MNLLCPDRDRCSWLRARKRDEEGSSLTLSKSGGQMRRAIAAAVMGGLVLGGVSATPAFAAAHSASRVADNKRSTVSAKERTSSSAKTKRPDKAKKPPAASKKPAAPARTKTVVYGGYEFQVPASWPVYQLDKDPRTCVRYDVHAVYLGTLNPDMPRQGGLIGRTQTVSFRA